MNTEKKLYQWDTGQKLTGCTGLYVDFPIDNEVYRVETADGTCIIPDELLQTSGGHKVYECMTNNTIRSFAFSVTPRPQPPDYVFTPTERLTFEGLVQKVDDAVADMIRRANSGEFDGHTPIKGTDYFTAEEIQQIQNEVSSGAIGEFKSAVNTETNKFNANATEKVNAYNQNDSEKTTSYNANATAKLNAYNTNANNRVAEFDSHTGQIQADISELKSDLVDLRNATTSNYDSLEIVESTPTIQGGYVTQSGISVESAEYNNFEISVKKGDVVSIYRSDGGVITSMRFLCVYVGDTVSEEKGGANVTLPYTVPDAVTKIVPTIPSYYGNVTVKIDRTVTVYRPKLLKRVEEIESFLKADNYIYKEKETLNANESFTLIDNLDVKKNTVFSFYGEFTSFSKLTLSHGYGLNYGNKIEITSTNVYMYYDNNQTPFVTLEHGLNLESFIDVRIEQGNSAYCYVYIMTGTGTYKSSRMLAYHSCRGSISVTSEATMYNAKILFMMKDIKSGLYYFGDSYTSLGDPSRFPKYLIEYGYDNYVLCGFGGGASVQEIETFRNIVSIRKPMYCVWALGMNDGDSATAINDNWKTCVDEIISYCNDNGIELILATIPNTPIINNTFKNDYVKATGKRYIDFAKAVGAESSGSSWYSDMLHTDNVHPTELGAKALCERLMIDVPEMMN